MSFLSFIKAGCPKNVPCLVYNLNLQPFGEWSWGVVKPFLHVLVGSRPRCLAGSRSSWLLFVQVAMVLWDKFEPFCIGFELT